MHTEKVNQADLTAFIQQAVFQINKHPEKVLPRFRLAAQRLAEPLSTRLTESEATKGLNGLRNLSRELHSVITIQHDDNPEALWHFARFMHRLGKPKDALPYLERILEIEPENTRALARKAETLMEIHEELPRRGYDEKAVDAARKAHTLEQSDYTGKLLSDAEDIIFERLRIENGDIPKLALVS